MNWSAYDNKNLIVPSYDDFVWRGKKYRKVILNEYLNSALVRMDPYWPPDSEIATSGVRVPADSLRIIRGYLKEYGLDKVYPDAMTCELEAKLENGEYIWQLPWSRLLNKNVIINPPLPAKCLLDYIRNGVNKKGRIIDQSPHIPRLGKPGAIDLSGIDSETIVKRLIEDEIIRGYLLERANNCIHMDV